MEMVIYSQIKCGFLGIRLYAKIGRLFLLRREAGAAKEEPCKFGGPALV